MRWKHEEQPETRVVERFLWFPTRLGYETRWLERVQILQQAVKLERTWLNHSFVESK